MGGILWDYSVCFDRDPETAGYSQPFCQRGKILLLWEGERAFLCKNQGGKPQQVQERIQFYTPSKHAYFTILFKDMHFKTVCLYEENDSPTEDLRGKAI